MKHRSVEMHELNVPLREVRKLSDGDRYTYYLLGHMFNELMCLQKLVAYSLPKHDDRRPARFHPEFAQTLMLFRIATGKVWEASKTLRSPQVSTLLLTHVLPKMDGGAKRLDQLNEKVDSAKWLRPLRNGMGFHFPSIDKWKEFVEPQGDWVDDSIFLGSATGNTFYASSESVAQHWMFSLIGVEEKKVAADTMINEMIELLRLMNSFIEDALGTLIAEHLLRGEVPVPVGTVLAPEFAAFQLPFWTYLGPNSGT